MSSVRARLCLLSGALLVALFACSSDPPKPPTPTMTRAQLLDPETCKSCHPTQFQEWSGSMHAYAADDPVFLAMNKRGQRETNGALGDFCVKCHAPMAVRDKLTRDGLNLPELPKSYKGVTCFFCHTVSAVTGTHDAALDAGQDLVMRGEYKDPLANTSHASVYAPTHDRDRRESADLCGACHDIETPHGAQLERTFQEWRGSVFSTLPSGATCAQCHMDQSTSDVPISNVAGSPKRRLHSHMQVGVDLALTDFPQRSEQKQKVQALLGTTLQTALCVKQIGNQSQVRVIADNVAAGHGFPSGSTQDRRVWFEVIAQESGATLFQSGAIADGADPIAMSDPDRWLLRDCIFDAQDKEVHMFWLAASFESNQLPPQATFDPQDARFYRSHVYKSFPAQSLISGVPDRVTLRVRMETIGRDVLDDLVKSGDLDPSITAPTLDVGATLEWTRASATARYFDSDNLPVDCVTTTNLNVGADKFPAPARTKCGP